MTDFGQRCRAAASFMGDGNRHLALACPSRQISILAQQHSQARANYLSQPLAVAQ